jgi:hypothetical protein
VLFEVGSEREQEILVEQSTCSLQGPARVSSETRTSTCRSFATISSGLYRFLAIAVLLDVKDIPQVGPLQWGWIKDRNRDLLE